MSRIPLGNFVWSFDFWLHQKNTLGKYTPNDGIKIKGCTCLPVEDDNVEEFCFSLKKNAELKIPYQEFLIFPAFVDTFLLKKKTRNATPCNNHDDLLHLSCTLKVSIFSEAYI